VGLEREIEGELKFQNKKFHIVLREVLGLHKIKEITLLKSYSHHVLKITLLHETLQYPLLFSILFTINLIYLAESNRNKRKESEKLHTSYTDCIFFNFISLFKKITNTLLSRK
jgi:hypothetical protein